MHYEGSIPMRQNGTLTEIPLAILSERSLPDNQYSVVGVDVETGVLVNAALSVSAIGHICVTCCEPIKKSEHHVVVGGRFWTNRQGEIVDHHHAHTACFHEVELLFWAATAYVSSSFSNFASLSSHRKALRGIAHKAFRAA